jgi:hypothetical protein
MFFIFPEDPHWNAARQAVEFGVEIGESRGVVRVPRRVFQRLLPERPTSVASAPVDGGLERGDHRTRYARASCEGAGNRSTLAMSPAALPLIGVSSPMPFQNRMRRWSVDRALPDRPAQRRAGVPRPQLGDLELVVRRLRFVVIALAIMIIAGFAVLGTQIWLMSARTDQLATKVNGIDASFGVKFEETNAKLDVISQRLAAEFKTIEAEIAAQTRAVAKSIAPFAA